jgi:NADH-quinone oxidoreductase subunit N
VSPAPVALVAAAPTSVTAPTIEYPELLPILVVVAVAVVGVLVEALAPRESRYVAQLALTVGGLLGALAAVVGLWGTQIVAAEGSLAVDGPTLFAQGSILALSLVAVLVFGERRLDPAGDAFAPRASSLPGSEAERLLTAERVQQTEVYPLLMFAVTGMLIFPAANDLLVLFVALEVLSLPLYLLCATARRKRLVSQEAAVKYFILGAFASAFMLYGIALLYGFAGSLRFSDIDTAVQGTVGMDALLLGGTALVSVGLLFKVGAAPFHAWTPDVYQGAPTPLTGFMAACTKVAAFGALLRVLYVALGGIRLDWQPMMWAVAIVTMVLGSVVALTQSDVKRMLAYSSIAHAGFLLTAVVAADDAALSAVLFYLAAYGFATIGAFAVVTLVRDAGGEATHLSRWAGLGKRSPWLAGVFAIFLLSFAGIPLTSGFVGKLVVFSAAVSGGALPLVIVGLICSAIAAFFYVRVIVLMFFSEPVADGPTVAVPGVLTTVAVAGCVGVTVLLGVLPGPLLQLAADAAPFVR